MAAWTILQNRWCWCLLSVFVIVSSMRGGGMREDQLRFISVLMVVDFPVLIRYLLVPYHYIHDRARLDQDCTHNLFYGISVLSIVSLLSSS